MKRTGYKIINIYYDYAFVKHILEKNLEGHLQKYSLLLAKFESHSFWKVALKEIFCYSYIFLSCVIVFAMSIHCFYNDRKKIYSLKVVVRTVIFQVSRFFFFILQMFVNDDILLYYFKNSISKGSMKRFFIEKKIFLINTLIHLQFFLVCKGRHNSQVLSCPNTFNQFALYLTDWIQVDHKLKSPCVFEAISGLLILSHWSVCSHATVFITRL